MLKPTPAPSRATSPEQLDRMMRVTPPLALPALLLLLAMVFAGLVWSLLSTAPVRAEAQGVLLNPAGVTDVVAPAAGRLLRLHATLGEVVMAGQMLAEIDQPELAADLIRRRLERDKLEERGALIRDFLGRETTARNTLAETRRAGLANRLSALRALEATMRDILAGQLSLQPRGLTTQDRVLGIRRQIEEAQAQRLAVEQELASLTAEAEAEAVRARRELLEVEMSLAATQRDIAWTEAEMARRGALRAPVAGRVVEIVLNEGEMAGAQSPVLRLTPGETEELIGVLYVAPRSSRPVQVGMAVQIVPATVRVLRDGYIEGVVTAVSPIAATPESMQRLMKNSRLVEQLSAAGAPVEVTVRLATDPASPSGYRWSGGAGPALRLANGTATEGRIITDRIPLLALVLPQVDYVMARLGL